MITFKHVSATNFGAIGKAKLSLDNQGLMLIRGINKDTHAAESNGSGKSTLFKAMSWCLFGHTIPEGKLADPTKVGETRCEVEVELEHGSTNYRIVRAKTSSKTRLTLYTDGVSTTDRAIKDMEKRIQEIIGLDWHAFRNTVLYGQGDHKRFADPSTTDAERKDILKKILRLDAFDKALDHIKLLIRDKTAVESGLKEDQRVAESILRESACNRDNLGVSYDQHEINRAKAVRELAEKIDDLDVIEFDKDRLDKLREHNIEAESQLVDIEEQFRGHQAKEPDHTLKIELNDELREANQELVKVAEKISLLAADVVRLDEAVEELKSSSVCPTCLQSIEASEHVQAKIASMESELKDKTKQKDGWSLKRNDLIVKVELTQNQLDREVQEANEWAKRGGELRSEAAEASRLVKKIDKAYSAMIHKQIEYDGRQELVKEYQTRIKVLAAEANPFAEMLSDARTAADDHHAKLNALKDKIEDVSKSLDPIRFWQKGFSNKGLPALVLDSVMPLITQGANHYLKILADGDIIVQVDTVGTLKGGGNKEAITITKTIEGNTDVTPSGGQECKISLAIDLALMDLVASREGAQIDLLLLDEVLDGLDAEGKSRVVDLLQHLRKTCSTVAVISHDDIVQEHFERVVTVTKQGGTARLSETD